MSSQNYFDLLGDDENEEPSAVVARALPPAAREKILFKKSQVSGGAAAARLPMKPSTASESPKDQKLVEGVRGGRGSARSARGGRGSHADRDRDTGSREISVQRESRDLFSRERGVSHSDKHVTSNRENDNEGFQGSRAGTYGGVSDGVTAHGGGSSETSLSDGLRGRGGRGVGRGRERGFGVDSEDRSRRREFDRRSGSGFGNEVKRDGFGRGNWGAEGDEGSQQEFVDPVKQEVKIEVVEREADLENQVASTAVEDCLERKSGEEDDNELTLDEYEKILEEKRKALLSGKAEERKVKADKAFASMQLVDKKNDQNVFIKLGLEKEKKKKEKEALEKEEKAKKTQSINEFLKPVDGEKYYGSAGSRGRGRSRGREGRSSGDPERPSGLGSGRSNLYGAFNSARRVSAPRIEDPGQFPILGAK